MNRYLAKMTKLLPFRLKSPMIIVVGILLNGVSFLASAQTFDSIPALRPTVPLSNTTRPTYAPIWSPLYELSGNSLFSSSQSQYVETSLYEPYNDFTRGWWDNIVEEFTYAGMSNTMVLTRAGVTENRQWDTLKTNLIPAIKRAGVYGNIKFGQFEDCGAWAGCYKSITGNSTIDWSDTTTMIKIFWDYCVKRFHDFMPADLWFRYNGRPVWMGWGSGGINYSGNVSKVLRVVKARFKAQYNEDLFMIIDQAWKKNDPTITGAEADAYDSWFCCGNAGTFTAWNNYTIGVCVPGFQDYNSDGTLLAYGADFDRDHGNKLRQYFDSSITRKANIVIEEGYVDMREGAGIYRSPKWDYPSQYLEIVREFVDQTTTSRRFQAEACDSFYNKTSTNTSVIYSSRKLDVGTLPAPNYGWYVGGTDVGDWLLWKAPLFASGTYDVYIRYASSTAGNLTLLMGGKTDNISLPSTSGAFQGKKIISSRSLSGNNDIKLSFQTAGMQVDFLHFDRIDNVSVINHSTAPSPSISGVKILTALQGARIEYFTPFDNCNIEMNIFTSNGRIIWNYHSTQSVKGVHSIDWAAANNAQGAYVVQMTIRNKSGGGSVASTSRCVIFSR